MPTFTLPKSKFPRVGFIFYVGVPLYEQDLLVSTYMDRMETTNLFYLDANGNPAIVSKPVDITDDFKIDGSDVTKFRPGSGFYIENGKDRVTGPDVQFTGVGWCNVWNPNPAPGHTDPCP